MTNTKTNTVVGVFQDREQAQMALRELRNAGFTESQIGVASPDGQHLTGSTTLESEEGAAGTGAAVGAATGAGVGALWGLGVLAGALPAIGPAIAGGTLAVLLSSAAAGAAAAGIAGALIGLGLSPEEAEYYESEAKAGRTIITVNAGSRCKEALALIQQFGGYDMSTRTTSQACATTCQTETSTAGQTAAATSASAAGGTRIQAVEEKLKINKTAVQVGEVVVRKEVHTEHKTVEVPVKREEIVIERHAGSGHAANASVGTDQEIRIPITEEQVHVEKQPVVAEEVTVGKRQVKGSERVDETLRKEKVKVERQGDVRVQDGSTRQS